MRKTILVKIIIIILILSIMSMLITYRDILLNNKNFLFESQYKQNLERNKNVFAHIVDFSFSFMQFHNALNRLIRIFRKNRFDFIIEFREKKCYFIILEIISFIAKS